MTSRVHVPDAHRAERHLVELLERRFGVTDRIVLRLAALTLRATAAGHSCLDLAQLDQRVLARLDPRRSSDAWDAPDVSERSVPNDASGITSDTGSGLLEGAGPEVDPLPGLAVALAALRACEAVHVVRRDPDGTAAAVDIPPCPLVLDGTRLATHRERRAEQRVLDALIRRRAAAPAVVARDRPGLTPDAGQLAAVRALLDAGVRAGIGVLTGGPGTGKTTTVAALLAARIAETEPDAPLRIALTAPTGKAAARLTQAVRSAADTVAEVHGPKVAATLADLEATTVHRLLGGGRDIWRRALVPLPFDLVIVDEASMLALPLASALLDALDPATQLVLVGDADQLMSVETGSVLRALVDGLPKAEVGGPVATLQVNHRATRADQERDAFIAAVRAGDVEQALVSLRAATANGADSALRWLETSDPGTSEAAIYAVLADDGHGGGLVPAAVAAQAGDGRGALAALDAVRLLCAHRHGPYGASGWNTRLRAKVAATLAAGPGEASPRSDVQARGARGISDAGMWVAGEPVMVLTNDEHVGLVNGDTGVVMGSGSTRRLVFARRDGTLLERSATALPDVDSAYAVTVHKSQGSEYATVVVVLPPADSPLALRELLYTAITRARDRVILVGDEAAVRAAITTRSLRMGGLAQDLVEWSRELI